jgi:beta-phosphoglucomutase
LDLILHLTGIEHYFSVLVSAEDTQRGKPDPQVFLVAADRLGIPPARCLVMEDAPAGVQAAKAGGMKCIAVSFVGHHADSALKEAGADLVVKTLEQVSGATIRRIFQSSGGQPMNQAP